MICQECGQEFVLDLFKDKDAQEFGRALDEHVQQHHQALFAVVVDPLDDHS